MKKIKQIIATVFLMASLSTLILGGSVFAQQSNIDQQTCDGINLATGKPAGTPCQDNNGADFSGIIRNVINILSILVGAVSVIMLIVGGFRYVISNGDSNATKGAKDTIMYALIGLVIVLFAQVIVRFVWTNASNSTTSQSGVNTP